MWLTKCSMFTIQVFLEFVYLIVKFAMLVNMQKIAWLIYTSLKAKVGFSVYCYNVDLKENKSLIRYLNFCHMGLMGRMNENLTVMWNDRLCSCLEWNVFIKKKKKYDVFGNGCHCHRGLQLMETWKQGKPKTSVMHQ